MIALKHPRIWCGIFIGVIVILAVVFHVRYGEVNDPKTAFRIKELEVNYGEPSIDINGIDLTVERPELIKSFDKDYNSDVVYYKIPFEAHNISETDEIDFDETNLQIVSGGKIQLGWPWNSYEDSENPDTNWGKLKPGETTRGYWIIEAVADEFPVEVYEDYELYYLQHDGDAFFKFRFVDKNAG